MRGGAATADGRALTGLPSWAAVATSARWWSWGGDGARRGPGTGSGEAGEWWCEAGTCAGCGRRREVRSAERNVGSLDEL